MGGTGSTDPSQTIVEEQPLDEQLETANPFSSTAQTEE